MNGCFVIKKKNLTFLFNIFLTKKIFHNHHFKFRQANIHISVLDNSCITITTKPCTVLKYQHQAAEGALGPVRWSLFFFVGIRAMFAEAR